MSSPRGSGWIWGGGGEKQPPRDEYAPPPDPRRDERPQTPRSESSFSTEPSETSERSGWLTPPPQEGDAPAPQLDDPAPAGIRLQDLPALDDKPPPRSLQALLDAIDTAMAGEAIVSPSVRDALLAAAAETHGEDLAWTTRRRSSDGSYYCCAAAAAADDQRDTYGPTPAPDAVLHVVAAAGECSVHKRPAADWNMDVHQRVLELAFRGSSPRPAAFGSLVDFMGSATASISPHYGGTPSSSKCADFCVYIDPAHDPSGINNETDPAQSVRAAIAHLYRTVLPGECFNFADFAPLNHRPIAFAIATEDPGAELDAAESQLGAWQAAHWAFLRSLVEGPGGMDQPPQGEEPAPQGSFKMQEGRAAEGSSGVAETQYQGNTEEVKQQQQEYRLPAFLPGIVIHGHDWHLGLTTADGQQQTTVVAIGDTASARGVYQIVFVLQVLRRWVVDEYWPWLRGVMLEKAGAVGGVAAEP